MKKRPRARTLSLIIDSLPFATGVFLKPEEGRNATGFTRCVRGDEVSSGASASCSGYAPLRGGLSVYIGLRLRLIDPAKWPSRFDRTKAGERLRRKSNFRRNCFFVRIKNATQRLTVRIADRTMSVDV